MGHLRAAVVYITDRLTCLPRKPLYLQCEVGTEGKPKSPFPQILKWFGVLPALCPQWTKPVGLCISVGLVPGLAFWMWEPDKQSPREQGAQ